MESLCSFSAIHQSSPCDGGAKRAITFFGPLTELYSNLRPFEQESGEHSEAFSHVPLIPGTGANGTVRRVSLIRTF